MIMAERDQSRPGIRHRRKPGLRDKSHIGRRTVRIGEHREQRLNLGRFRVLIQLMEFKFGDMPFKPGGGKVAAGGSGLLDSYFRISFKRSST